MIKINACIIAAALLLSLNSVKAVPSNMAVACKGHELVLGMSMQEVKKWCGKPQSESGEFRIGKNKWVYIDERSNRIEKKFKIEFYKNRLVEVEYKLQDNNYKN